MWNWFGKRTGVLALILILSAVVYSNALWNPFHFDDAHHIQRNSYLTDIKNIPSYFVDMRSFSAAEGHSGHYRPLLLASHALNYFAGGLDPFGYHVVNLLFHSGSAFLIFLIIVQLLKKEEGAFFIAISASIFFAVNPFNAEVVNYISARSSVMCSFFYLLSFYCWVMHRENPPLSPFNKGGLRGICYMASFISFLLAILTKEIAITLPVMIWLYDVYFVHVEVNGRMEWLKLQVRKIYVYLPFVVFVVIPYFMIRSLVITGTTVLPEPDGSYTIPIRGFIENLLTQPKVLLKYIQLFFLPFNLTVEHDITESHSILDLSVIIPAGLILALVYLAVWLFRKNDNTLMVISFFMAWFFVVQLPTTIIPLYAILQENRGYLAVISLAVFFGIALYKMTSVNFIRTKAGRYSPVIPVVILALIVLVYSAGTIDRNRVWADDVTLWSDAVSKSPQAPRAHHNLALAFNEAGHLDSAIEELRKVIELEPTLIMAYYNLGNIYNKRGMIKAAIAEYGKALEIDPFFYQAHNNIGMAYWRIGEVEPAIAHLKKAYEIKPEYGLALRNLEKIYMSTSAQVKKGN